MKSRFDTDGSVLIRVERSDANYLEVAKTLARRRMGLAEIHTEDIDADPPLITRDSFALDAVGTNPMNRVPGRQSTPEERTAYDDWRKKVQHIGDSIHHHIETHFKKTNPAFELEHNVRIRQNTDHPPRIETVGPNKVKTMVVGHGWVTDKLLKHGQHDNEDHTLPDTMTPEMWEGRMVSEAVELGPDDKLTSELTAHDWMGKGHHRLHVLLNGERIGGLHIGTYGDDKTTVARLGNTRMEHKYAGRGYLHHVYSEAIKHAKELGADRIESDTMREPQVDSVYKKLGFKLSGDPDMPDAKHRDMRYMMDLPKPVQEAVQSLREAGFTGIITAKNGVKFHYVNGVRVASHHQDFHLSHGEAQVAHPDDLDDAKADAFAAQIKHMGHGMHAVLHGGPMTMAEIIDKMEGGKKEHSYRQVRQRHEEDDHGGSNRPTPQWKVLPPTEDRDACGPNTGYSYSSTRPFGHDL